MQDQQYNFNGQEYTQNGLVTLDENCNGINIINTGSTEVVINGIPLAPPIAPATVGDSYSIGGNRGERLKGRVQLSFAGGTGKCVVVQKFYLENCI